MKKTTTITYNIETRDGISMSEIEYKDYVKNERGEENLLHYKVRNCVETDAMKVIGDSDGSDSRDSRDSKATNESFNKIYKVDDVIDETIGVSSNNKDWKIHEYKNHQLNKEYEIGYDTIKFDIKSDLLETSAGDGAGATKARSYIENE
jgi:hypothetical protein